MPTTVTPYLSFGGNTREAFAFYEKALGARIETMMSYADMPASTAANTLAPPGSTKRACMMPSPLGAGPSPHPALAAVDAGMSA